MGKNCKKKVKKVETIFTMFTTGTAVKVELPASNA